MGELRLGVNVDHVATLRQARGCDYPDPLEAALAAERGGARSITVHLREDRRHIQESDVIAIKNGIATKLNLEMAAADEIVEFACELEPADVCVVPEKRQELTTEGGLSVAGREDFIAAIVGRLSEHGIRVSLFIDPDPKEIKAAAGVGAEVVELHTGSYAEASDPSQVRERLDELRKGATCAAGLGLTVNGGHGLTLANVAPVAAIEEMEELNIGHSIVSRAIMVGIEEAVREMNEACLAARKTPAA